MAAATEANIRRQDDEWEADAGRRDDGTAAAIPGRVRAGFFCVYSADNEIAHLQTPGGTDADRDQATAYAVDWSRRGQDYIVRHHDGDRSPFNVRHGDTDPGQVVATASDGELRWGPRHRFFAVYSAYKGAWCFQAAGDTDADRDRACAEATWRSLHWGGSYIIREHDGDPVRDDLARVAPPGTIVGTASHGQLELTAGTAAPEIG
jgi:hypothetical protein